MNVRRIELIASGAGLYQQTEGFVGRQGLQILSE